MMFSGKTITIKKSADRATADKYLQAMKKAGAVATAKAMESDAQQPQILIKIRQLQNI